MIKLRVFIIGLIFCLSSLYVNGQTEKGKFLLGGASSFELNSTSYNGGERRTQIHFAPQISYFVFNGLSLGVQLPLRHYIGKSSSTTYFELSPMIRYYLGKKDIKPFIHVSHNLIGTYRYHIYSNDGIKWIRQKITTSEIYGGLSFFLNQTVSIELSLGYKVYSSRNLNYEDSGNKSSELKLGVGVSIFL